MDNKTKKNLTRLVNHLGLSGFGKIAKDIEEVIEEDDEELSLEKESDYDDELLTDLNIAEIALTVYSSIEQTLSENNSDFEEVIDDLEYVDIEKSEYTELERIVMEEIEQFQLEASLEELEELMHTVLSRYNFIEHLEDESIFELGDQIKEDIEDLE